MTSHSPFTFLSKVLNKLSEEGVCTVRVLLILLVLQYPAIQPRTDKHHTILVRSGASNFFPFLCPNEGTNACTHWIQGQGNPVSEWLFPNISVSLCDYRMWDQDPAQINCIKAFLRPYSTGDANSLEWKKKKKKAVPNYGTTLRRRKLKAHLWKSPLPEYHTELSHHNGNQGQWVAGEGRENPALYQQAKPPVCGPGFLAALLWQNDGLKSYT